MKILHTGDWHLGKKLENFSRLEEQITVLEEINFIADHEHVDVILIAGDLFDTFNPQVEAVELFYKTLKNLSKNGERPIIAIAGNHDSPDRINLPDPLAKTLGIILVGYPNAEIKPFELDSGLKILKAAPGFIELKLPNVNTPLRLILTPYANEVRLKQYLGVEDKVQRMNQVLKENWEDIANKYCDHRGVNMLIAHLYMLKKGGEELEEPEGERPLNIGNADAVYSELIPQQIQYTALGHLHRCHEIGGHENPVMYSGSPLSYSFKEAGQQKYVVLIEAEAGQKVTISKQPLQSGKPLFRKKFNDIPEAISWLQENQNALVELTLEREEFLKPSELKMLYDNHSGILNIIPIVKNQINELSLNSSIDLTKDIQSLFIDYFFSKKNQKPNQELLDLFNEATHLDESSK